MKGVWRFHNLAGLGVYPGIPDDIAVHKGKVYALEYKAKKGTLSLFQETFKLNWEEFGQGNCIWITVRSLEDIINAGL